MDNMSVNSAGFQQQGWTAEQGASQPGEMAPAAGGGETGIQAALSQAEDENQSLIEMMEDARERTEAHRKALEKFQKSTKNTRYGDAPLEAYARLARAKSESQVNAASGYARRRLAQLRAALQQDPDNAAAIKGAINQLQKAVNRAEKKKKELAREDMLESQRKRSQEQEESQREQRLRQEIRRRKSQRMLRESGYLREAEVGKRLDAQLTQTQMELRQQAQDLSAATGVSLDAAAQQYAAAAAPGEAPSGEISVQA